MIGLVLAMLRRRWSLAATVTLLVMVAAAAATAAPVYTAAAERSVVSAEIDSARPAERSASLFVSGVPDDLGSTTWVPTASRSFDQVLSVETSVAIEYRGSPGYPRLIHREAVCGHLRLLAGRCNAGAGEALLGERTAKDAGVGVGDALPVTPASVSMSGAWTIPSPQAQQPLVVVGIYRIADPGDRYWAGNQYAVTEPGDRRVPEAILTNLQTIGTVHPAMLTRSVDLLLRPSAVTSGSTRRLRTEIASLSSTAAQLGQSTREYSGVGVTTSLPNLLDRIDAEVRLVDEVVPVTAMPMVLICWFVIFLAVAYGAAERRGELGLLALRGVSAPHRWWLAAGESALPIAVGAALGYLLGWLAVRVLAPLLLEPVPVPLDGVALGWTGAAVAGAVVAGLVALRREMATPAGDLLREATTGTRAWQAWTMEAVVVALAAAACLQLRATGGRLTGMAQLVPTLTVLAVGLVVARAVRPLARLTGRWAGRRGHIAMLLAARQVGRGGGVTRLIPLLVVVVSLLGFGLAAADVADRGRHRASLVALGARRVLELRTAPASKVLAAVRAVDPQGRYAMAVVPIRDRPGAPDTLAVDATRLAGVSAWPPGAGISARDAVARLRPGSAKTATVRGSTLTAEVTLDSPAPAARATVSAVLIPPDGQPLRVDVGSLRGGAHQYQAPIACESGCRVAQLSVQVAESASKSETKVLIGGLRGGSADDGQSPVDALTDPDRWRIRDEGTAFGGTTRSGDSRDNRNFEDGAQAGEHIQQWATGECGEGGLAVTSIAQTRTASVDFLLIDGVDAVPAVAVGRPELPRRGIAGIDDSPLLIGEPSQARTLPGIGGQPGLLLDLERVVARSDPLTEVNGEVWLSANAPGDVVKRLAGVGLRVSGERSATQLLHRLESRGSAAAVRFTVLSVAFLAVLGAGAVLLVALADRRRLVGQLRSLRIQGVRRRTVTSATVGGLVWACLASLIGGGIGGGVAWWVAGTKLPVLASDSVVAPPRWPGIGVTLATGGALVAGFMVLAVTTAMLLRAARRVDGGAL